MLSIPWLLVVCSGVVDLPFHEGADGVSPRTMGEGKFRLHAGWKATATDRTVLAEDLDSRIESGSRIESFPFGFGWGMGTWTDLALTGAYHRESGLPMRESMQSGFGDTWLHLRQQIPLDGLAGPASLAAKGRIGLPTGERGRGLWARDRFQQPSDGSADTTGSTAFGGADWGWGASAVLGLEGSFFGKSAWLAGEAGIDGSAAAGRDPELSTTAALGMAVLPRLELQAGLRWSAPLHRGDSSAAERTRAFAGAGARIARGLWLTGGIWGALGDRSARTVVWKASPSGPPVAFSVAQDAPGGWSLALVVELEARDPDADGDGVPDRLDRCPEAREDLDGFQDGDGCPDPDDDRDAVCDAWVDAQGAAGRWASVCRGIDLCPRSAEDIDGFEDRDGCPDPDNDRDGLCDVAEVPSSDPLARAVCKGHDRCTLVPEDFDGFQDLDGCPDPDNDGDGIADSLDACPDMGVRDSLGIDSRGCPVVPAAPPPPPAVAAPVEVPRPVEPRRWTIPFDFDLDTARAGSDAVIDSIGRLLRSDDSLVVAVEGNTDARGEAERNQELSERRAKWTARRLAERGVAEFRIRAFGRGMSNPVALNEDESGRARNRRCEIVVFRAVR